MNEQICLLGPENSDLTLKQARVENDQEKIISCHFLYHLDLNETYSKEFLKYLIYFGFHALYLQGYVALLGYKKQPSIIL